MSRSNPLAEVREAAEEARWQEIVRQHIASLRYGTVEIIVHDGQVIQIDKTERVRLPREK